MAPNLLIIEINPMKMYHYKSIAGIQPMEKLNL